MNKRFNIHHLLSFDEAGNVKPLTTEQLLDVDVRAFYQAYYRDGDTNMYIKMCGVIYYLGDPNSPPMQEGLNEKECLKRAIHDYELAPTYTPDAVMEKLINKFRASEFTILNEAALSLERSVHISMLVSDKYRELLLKKLNELNAASVTKESLEAVGQVVGMMQQISKEVDEFPKRVEKLKAAKEAVFSDMEDTQLRGGIHMTESMNRNFAVQ